MEPLVRLGAENLVLAEPDVYELHNTKILSAFPLNFEEPFMWPWAMVSHRQACKGDDPCKG